MHASVLLLGIEDARITIPMDLQKRALTTYLSGLRNRLSSKNVHVMTVKPGYVKTKMTKDLNIPNILKVSPNYVAKNL